MSCRELNEQISLYLDGLLNPAQTRKLKEHAAICSKCQQKLSLMQEIPVALRTDRMLAPRPEFTTVVMQQILISQHVKNMREAPFRGEAQSVEPHSLAAFNSEKNAQPAFKIMPLPSRREKPPKARYTSKTPVDYVLRFASLAAAIVLVVGIGVYFSNTGQVVGGTATQATVSNAISSFAALVINSFQTPLVLLLGFLLAAVIVLVLWWFFKRNNSSKRL